MAERSFSPRHLVRLGVVTRWGTKRRAALVSSRPGPARCVTWAEADDTRCRARAPVGPPCWSFWLGGWTRSDRVPRGALATTGTEVVAAARPRRGRASNAEPRDRGSGTILVVSLMGVIWLVAVTLMTAGGVRAARHRAYAAADMAALAAAERAREGPSTACRSAAEVAHDMGARLTRCALSRLPQTNNSPATGTPGDLQIADVSVTATLRGVKLVGVLQVSAAARAGPAAAPQAP